MCGGAYIFAEEAVAVDDWLAAVAAILVVHEGTASRMGRVCDESKTCSASIVGCRMGLRLARRALDLRDWQRADSDSDEAASLVLR